MYANGWVNESITDDSDVAFITEFEKELPLRNISLTEFERRLKKLITPTMEDMAPVRIIEECFKDHWAFLDICEEGSLTREMMFDETFLDEVEPHEFDQTLSERRIYIPWLMLLGLMYCRSNRKQRAEKFYELVEIQLTENLSSTDRELVAYLPIMVEIVYGLMFRMYERHRNQAPDSGQPKIEIEAFLPTDYEQQNEKVQEQFKDLWMTDLFKAKSRLPRKNVEDKICNDLWHMLQPHFIRKFYRTKL